MELLVFDFATNTISHWTNALLIEIIGLGIVIVVVPYSKKYALEKPHDCLPHFRRG